MNIFKDKITTFHQHCMKSFQIRIFFWSVFSCIWTEYGDLPSKSRYSVRIQENTDQKKLRFWTLFPQCNFSKLFRYLLRSGLKSSSALSLIMISILSLFECITRSSSSSLSLEEIKLIAIVN